MTVTPGRGGVGAGKVHCLQANLDYTASVRPPKAIQPDSWGKKKGREKGRMEGRVRGKGREGDGMGERKEKRKRKEEGRQHG